MLNRTEILPGVWLSHLQSDKFKTACFSVTLLTQLKRETASLNALIPFVLRRGTTLYPDLNSLSGVMDGLYGCAIEPVVRRVGEIQCIGFFASIPESDFLPGREDILTPAMELMGQMLLEPTTRGGLLLPQYVDSEKEKLAELIRSRVNNKVSYSIHRCIEQMCCCEDYSAGTFGHEEDVENINYKKLTRQYRELLLKSPVEIFYCGRADEKTLAGIVRDAFSTMPRGELDYDIGTDVRMNSLEAEPRYIEEQMDIAQGKLCMGFRLGECMEEPNPAALLVFNNALGGSSASKLFRNVREKLSLCYYATSILEWHKGLLLIASGIETEKFDAAKAEIFAQLKAMADGEISDDEMTAAKVGVASDLRAAMDSPGELEGFYLSQALDGLDYGPMELAELTESVCKQDVISIAKSVECDTVYFLKGTGEVQEEDNDEQQ